jgi:pyrimidine-nucleoside phosphorylase
MDHAKRFGIVLSGQTADLAPADGKFYALRDVTGTVPSMPLIASSIMSKKLAAGAQAILLDVKTGSGAFMKTVDEAQELAHIMVDIGVRAGRRMTALISDMNQPLGGAVGNALEVREVIDTLRGGGPEDLVEHCLVVAAHMLRLAGKTERKDLADARPQVKARLREGQAWDFFCRLVEAQGGDVKQIENPDLLPAAPTIREVGSPYAGTIKAIDAREVGLTALELGAGRTRKDQPVDHAVGVVVHCKVGDSVRQGQPLFTIHARSEAQAHAAEERMLRAHSWGVSAERLPIFYDTIFGEDPHH